MEWLADARANVAARGRATVVALALTVSGCTFVETSPTPAITPTPAAATPLPDTPAPTPSGPTAPAPPDPLALDAPIESDPRRVSVSIDVAIPADAGGSMGLTVTNLSDSRIEELVLRWPTDLAQTLYLAPFVASEDRIRDGGSPLVQEWTKWVIGPGARGEPAGTTSLGYGPMDPGMTLEIPLFVTRNGAGPVAFDLQLLAAEALLTLEAGEPGEVRVEVP